MSQAKKGFTIIEVAVSMVILVLVIGGVLLVFLSSSALTELSRNTTIALSASEDKIEEIRDYFLDPAYNFDDTINEYSPDPDDYSEFTVTQLKDARGFVYVSEVASNTSPIILEKNILRVKVTVCWENLNGRVTGEDSNLNGVIDAGEDSDGDDGFDSPATIITWIATRGID